MKIKPSKKSGSVVVELNPGDAERLSEGAELGNGAPPPFKLTKILVPIDFSDCSKKALQYAVPFAKQFGATITLLHVVQGNYVGGPEFGALDFPLTEIELKKSAEKQLAELAAADVQEERGREHCAPGAVPGARGARARTRVPEAMKTK